MNGISLYRFEPADEKRIISLSDNKLWFSDPLKFNDLFDFQLKLQYLVTRSGHDEEKFREAVKILFKDKHIDNAHYLFSAKSLKFIKEWATSPTSRTLEQICAEIKHHFTSFGVQCFMKSLGIPLAWAHYASSHKGFCIEYAFSPMTFATQNNHLAQYYVNYVSKLPEICISELLFSPHQALAKFVASKSVNWSYEQELRLVNFEKKATAIGMPEGLKIKTLIAGYKMSTEHKQLLKYAAETLQTEYDEMTIAREGLALKSSALD